MDVTPSVTTFDRAYRDGDPPWVIGGPQPAVVALADAGLITGRTLDLGCGAGEHTILLARRGLDVLGADACASAGGGATPRAAAAGGGARVTGADGRAPAGLGTFDTVLDSALFHVFDPGDQLRYARGLAGLVRPGGVVHLLALARTGDGPEFGPVIDESEIRTAFDRPDWTVEAVQRTTYRGVVTGALAPSVGRPAGTRVDEPAHLARIRRS